MKHFNMVVQALLHDINTTWCSFPYSLSIPKCRSF